MKISFTGIHNINTNSGYRNVAIELVNPDGSRSQHLGSEIALHLNCRLNDDEKGKDLGDFYNAMHKSNFYCPNTKSPYDVDIKAKIFSINDEDVSGQFIDYTINDYPIELDEPSNRHFLPLYSFIAKLSSKIAKQNNLTSDELRCTNAINQCCSAKAEYFIENIM